MWLSVITMEEPICCPCTVHLVILKTLCSDHGVIRHRTHCHAWTYRQQIQQLENPESEWHENKNKKGNKLTSHSYFSDSHLSLYERKYKTIDRTMCDIKLNNKRLQPTFHVQHEQDFDVTQPIEKWNTESRTSKDDAAIKIINGGMSLVSSSWVRNSNFSLKTKISWLPYINKLLYTFIDCCCQHSDKSISYWTDSIEFFDYRGKNKVTRLDSSVEDVNNSNNQSYREYIPISV